jgi:hypothetical protein
MQKEVEDIIRVFAKRVYDLQFVDVPEGTRNSAVDRDCRIISDFIGCEKVKVTHSTYYVLKNCKRWSKKAIKLYNTLEGSHSTRCSSAKSGQLFTIEHEYPLGIVKKMVQDKKFKSVDSVITYMKKYAVPVIVTLEEDAKLRTSCRTASSLSEAKGRYKKVGIVVDHFTDWK